MSLAPFTYCLPALLGYTLFVGISGRFDPLSRPHRLADRPSWGLGLWTGVAVALTLTTLPFLAGDTLPAAVRGPLAPGAWLLPALLLPGLIAWAVYRGTVSRLLEADARSPRQRTACEGASTAREGAVTGGAHLPAPGIDPTIVERATAEATGDATNAVPASARVAFSGAETATAAAIGRELGDDERAYENASVVATFLDVTTPGPVDVPDIPVAPVDDANDDDTADGRYEAVPEVPQGELAALRLALRTEQSLRAETEKHLRITRRALGVLEAESRDDAGGRTDTLIALEEELESRIREYATAESRATREAARRFEAETEIVTLKQDMLAARREARRGTEARARALAVASRSVALTRRAVQARERAERQLHECETRLRASEISLADRQGTISSLIGALEKEKRRTREEVTTLARQLMLHEQRGVAEAAHDDEGRLSTRLARKVARARPLISGS